MSPSHDHPHAHAHHSAGGNLAFAFALNALFVGVEVVGGLWTNSIAILADAVHDAGDALSLGIAWYLERLSRRQADEQFTYGYRRFSVLGGLVTGVLLLVGLSFVLWRAVERLWQPADVNASGMMGLAVLGIAVNGAAYFRLRHAASLNEQVVGWHLLEDVLGWIAVLIGAGIMTLWDVPIIDPLLSLLISLFVLVNVLRKLRRVALVFLQSAPEGFAMDEFREQVMRLPHVRSLHHAHVWTLDGEHHVLTMHVVAAAGVQRSEIVELRSRIVDILRNKQVQHATIAVELEGEPCDGSVLTERDEHEDPPRDGQHAR